MHLVEHEVPGGMCGHRRAVNRMHARKHRRSPGGLAESREAQEGWRQGRRPDVVRAGTTGGAWAAQNGLAPIRRRPMCSPQLRRYGGGRDRPADALGCRRDRRRGAGRGRCLGAADLSADQRPVVAVQEATHEHADEATNGRAGNRRQCQQAALSDQSPDEGSHQRRPCLRAPTFGHGAVDRLPRAAKGCRLRAASCRGYAYAKAERRRLKASPLAWPDVQDFWWGADTGGNGV